jgi:hypothetical protein
MIPSRKTKVGSKVRLCYDSEITCPHTTHPWVGRPWRVKHINSDGTLLVEHTTLGGTLHRKDNVRSWVRA